MKKLIMAFGLAVPFTMAHASGLNIMVGEESIGLTVQSSRPDPGPVGEIAVFHNSETEATLVDAGLFVSGKRGGLTGRMGAKAYFADIDRLEGYGVALGLDVIYPLGSGLALESGVYLGPSSLAFNDVDRFKQWYFSASFEIFPNAKLAAGIGSLDIQTEYGNTIEVNDGLFLEMKLKF